MGEAPKTTVRSYREGIDKHRVEHEKRVAEQRKCIEEFTTKYKTRVAELTEKIKRYMKEFWG